MILFNDTEIFTSGSGGKKVFDLPDTELMLYDNFFTKEESDHYYTTYSTTRHGRNMLWKFTIKPLLSQE